MQGTSHRPLRTKRVCFQRTGVPPVLPRVPLASSFRQVPSRRMPPHMNGVLTSKKALSITIPRTRAATVARLLVTILVFVGLFGTSGCVGYSGNPNTQTQKGNLVITPNSISFGSVGVGSSASQTAIVSNRGTADVTLTNITATGSGFSVTGFSGPTMLTPGQTIKLTAAFKPKSSGQQSGSISVTIARQPTPVTATLTGTGATSNLSMTPSPVDFGNVS